MELSKKLAIGEPIILNTGRAIDFIVEKILQPLEKRGTPQESLEHIFSVGEKGAVTIEYKNGQRQEFVDRSISVPFELQNEVRILVEKKFSDAAFYDTTKKTMISIEMLDSFSVDEFRKRQIEVNRELEHLLKCSNLSEQYRVDPSRISTDVENKYVGKDLGMERGLRWLEARRIQPEKFITFGDSRSDILMAVTLHERGYNVEFVFVGEKHIFQNQRFGFPIVFTKAQCEAGTAEYLQGSVAE